MNTEKATADELLKFIGKNLGSIIHPIGSVYISEKPDDPANLFGGTWEQVKDTFILAAGDTYKAGATGGEATHTLTAVEMPKHNHRALWGISAEVDDYLGGSNASYGCRGGNEATGTRAYITSDQGGGQPHNNMPPYIAMYIWKRIA